MHFSFFVIRELLYATLEALVTNDLTSYTGSPNYSAIRNVIMGCSNSLLASSVREQRQSEYHI